MRYEYVVTLKRDNEKRIDAISLCSCFVSVIAFVLQQIANGQFSFFFSFAAAMILYGAVFNIISAKNGKSRSYRNWLLIAGLFWIGMSYLQWLSVFFFILAFLEYQAKYPLEVGFANHEVVINTLFKKKIPWSDFNNVMLKDGILTLDRKNNRIFQKEVLDDDDPDADEDEFNEYCRQQLKNLQATA